MARYEVGMRWGRIEVIAVDYEYRLADGIKESWDWAMLKCACGKEWKVDWHEINKYTMKSCGECPDGEVGPRGGKVKGKSDRKPGRPVLGKSKSLPVMLTLPEHLVKEAKERFCKGEDGVSFSGLVAECLEAKLEEKSNAN